MAVIGRSKPQRTKSPTEATPAPERFVISITKNTQYARKVKTNAANAPKAKALLSEKPAAAIKLREDVKPVEIKMPSPIPNMPESCSKNQIIRLTPFQNRRRQAVRCKGLL